MLDSQSRLGITLISTYVDMSGNPEFVGSSPFGGKKLAVSQTFLVWICKGFVRHPWPQMSPHQGDKLGTWRHVDCIRK